MLERLEELEIRYLEIERLMADPEVATDPSRLVALGKEHASLGAKVGMYRAYRETLGQVKDAEAMLEDGSDPDLAELAQEELASLKDRQDALEEEL